MKDTRARLLDAATRVFARDGISGATTREIARVARVNEVTLFRYFRNKNELLRQVVHEFCRKYAHVFDEAPCNTAADVRATVEAHAAVHLRKLIENEQFTRTFLGELKRLPKLSRQIFVQSLRPVRQHFIDYLKLAQKRRLVRANLNPTIAADALTGLLMSGILRRPLTEHDYGNEEFSKTCVEVFLRGIQP